MYQSHSLCQILLFSPSLLLIKCDSVIKTYFIFSKYPNYVQNLQNTKSPIICTFLPISTISILIFVFNRLNCDIISLMAVAYLEACISVFTSISSFLSSITWKLIILHELFLITLQVIISAIP